MKTITLLLLALVAVVAQAKSPFQLSGALESASFTPDAVTFRFSGELSVDDRTVPPAGHASRFRLVHVAITAKQYSVLSESGDRYFHQDRTAVETLVRQSTKEGHKIRGGAAGVTLTFSAMGGVESIALDSVSLMNSTIIDPIMGEKARAAREANH